jgi:PAS domain S-box-containing protein
VNHGREIGKDRRLSDSNLLRAIASAATDAIVTIDVNSKILFVNPAIERIFGYAADELLGKPLTVLMPDYLRHLHERALDSYLQTRERHLDWAGVELPGLHRDGHEVMLEVSFGETEIDDGTVFTGLIRDITARKQAEARHRESEERFRLLVEGVTDYAIFMLDAEGRVSSWNSGAERIIGYQADEIIGEHFSRFYPPDDVETGRPRRELELAEQEGRYREEGWRVRKDGSRFVSDVTVTPLHHDDGSLRGFAKITRDITERKKAEEERERLHEMLVHERETLHEIFAQAPAFIATLRGPEHRYEIVNPRYLELAGRKDVVGKTVREVLPEVEGQGYLELLDRIYESGERFSATEMPVEIQREGEETPTSYFLNLVLQPLRDADGSVLGIFIHGVNVTEEVLARREVEEVGRRMTFLAEASGILASSLDNRDILGSLTQLVVSYLADWCTIVLVTEEGSVERVSAAHADPEKDALARELVQGVQPGRETHGALFEVLETGRPKLYRHFNEASWNEVSQDPQQLPVLERMGMRSALVVPLTARGQVLGAIFMARNETEAPFDHGDLELGMELAGRAAVAVENARLHSQARMLNEKLEARVLERTSELAAANERLKAEIAEREEAEEALRESEARFRLLTENAPHVLAAVKRDGTISYTSPSAIRILGYQPEQLLGSSAFDYIHPDDLQLVSLRFGLLLQKPGTEQSVVYRYRHGDGSWRFIETVGKLPDATAENMIINAQDVTPRVRAEDAIRELNRKLRKRSEQLATTNKELESFSYSVSHDLRAPLRGVDGFTQALLEDYGEQLDSVGRKYLERVRAAAKRMGELIDDLLNLSRLSRVEKRWETVNLSSIAEQISEELMRRDPDRKVQFSIEPELEAGGDRRLLTALMENLLENAWKFTGKQERAVIEVGRKETGNGTAYFVKDNGAGFDMSYVERLFVPFQRLHGAEEFEGTGIGLATVQRIVNRHDGKIWAEGEVGKGASFYFTLGG